MQRNWSQKQLAEKAGTTQAVISRLEDPSYGKLSLKTLFDLSAAFDSGLRVEFVSFVTMFHQTFRPSTEARIVPAFEEEAESVLFYDELRPRKNYTAESTVISKNFQRACLPVIKPINSWNTVSNVALVPNEQVEIFYE